MELRPANVSVFVAEANKGHSPEQMAEMCVNRIVDISDTAHPVIREQARMFRRHMQEVVLSYMKKAVNSDRTTVYNALKEAGHPELAEMVRSL